jgi:hypothetical protein
MTSGKAIITLVIVIIGLAAAWLIGYYLKTAIGVWGVYTGVLIAVATLLYVTSKPELKDFFVVPALALMITIAWIIGHFSQIFIGYWGIFVAIIVFLLELAAILDGFHVYSGT